MLDQPSTIFLDVAGYNYKAGDIEPDHRSYPDRVIYASESYPRDAWEYAALAARAPYFLGEFVWTAMDYIGEAGIGLAARVPVTAPPYAQITFPTVNAYCGDVDLIGDQKPQSRYRDVVWGLSALELLVQTPIRPGEQERIPLWGWSDESPSWSWHGREGQPLAVRIYSSGDRVELRLNGQQVGSRGLSATDRMRAEFSVPYCPGTLEAVAYRSGREIARRTLVTAGAPAKLRLRPETARLPGKGRLAFIHVDVLDAVGRQVRDAAIDVSLAIDGPLRLLAFGAAGPQATGSFQATTARTFHGRALAIVQATATQEPARIEVRADRLTGGAAILRAG
jgi:beta-galactosidase